MAKRRRKQSEDGAADEEDLSAAPPAQRIDKWLFYARFFKTRSLAATVVSKGRLRLNGQRQSKPGHAIGPGDVLTFPMGNDARVIRVVACATRRGPAAEAQTLYVDLAPAAKAVGPDPLD